MNSTTKPCLAAILTLWAGAVAAGETEHPFDIPAQPLHSALQKLAEQAEVAVFFAESQVAGKRSPTLKGRYTTQDAVAHLLGGSGLQFSVAEDGSVAVKPATERVNRADPIALPKVDVIDQADYDPDDPYNPSYTRPNASTATKTDTPIMETPMSIEVVPSAVIQDQQAIQLGDAVKNVSGVFQGISFGGFSEEVMIRGFNTKFANYLDGSRFPASRIPTASADRIEVVKGAAANLYGRIEPGGMINVVTKRPQEVPFYALQQQFGSFDLYRITADATGPITSEGSPLYRFNLEYLDKNSFRDFLFTDRILVAPSLTWKISDRTLLDLDFMYFDEDTREDYGVPAIGKRPANIPISRYLQEPSTDKSNTKLYNVGVTLNHQFMEDWKVRARFVKFNRDVVDPQTVGFALNETTGLLDRFFYGPDSGDDSYFGTVDVTGRFSTWGGDHRVLVGWDYYNIDTKVSAFNLRVLSISSTPSMGSRVRICPRRKRTSSSTRETSGPAFISRIRSRFGTNFISSAAAATIGLLPGWGRPSAPISHSPLPAPTSKRWTMIVSIPV